jgi:SAM-dependent methyltransferase
MPPPKTHMQTDSIFPENIRLNQPERRQQLVQEFYEAHHQNRDIGQAKDDEKKLRFFAESLQKQGAQIRLGIDLGCRGGAITSHLTKFGNWIGVDIDRNAISLANQRGIPCVEMDITTAIDLQSNSVDAVCLTEVLEHLPYPSVTLNEVWRILEKKKESVFMGSVPIDYHLHRRLAVARGKRLTSDPTHLHSFSYQEIKALLEHYFEHVEFKAMRGTKARHDWLSWRYFVRDIAWFAYGPKKDVGEWDIRVVD